MIMFFLSTLNNSVNQPKDKNKNQLHHVEDASHRECACKLPIIIMLSIIFILFLVFLVTFIIFPLIFKCSPKLQKEFIFPIGKSQVENYFEYRNFRKHNILGIRNMYVSLQNTERIVLGVWHILPEELVANSSLAGFDYDTALLDSKFPVLLYFHQAVGNRITYVESYNVLRKFFHVLAFDYRCYGDSSQGDLTEVDIVNDSVALYNWLSSQTSSDIYFWGHSFGCILASHTLTNLKNSKSSPVGLFLEAPFSTMIERVHHQMTMRWLTKLITFMPWFQSTMLQPFDDNGFNYNLTRYITQINCPIVIIHAQNDVDVPFSLGFKLFEQLQNSRNTTQGNVTFYALNDYFCGNTHNVSEPKLESIIKNHLDSCLQYKNHTV